ncbi:MAG: membrane protein insertase YidC [Legionellales bacterium]|nr:membrane protein insertase YidC [Legionellales bacterium]
MHANVTLNHEKFKNAVSPFINASWRISGDEVFFTKTLIDKTGNVIKTVEPSGNFMIYEENNSLISVNYLPTQKNKIQTLQLQMNNPIPTMYNPHEFQGFAKYFNSSIPIKINSDGEISYLSQDNTIYHIKENEWIGWKMRFIFFIISTKNADININDKNIQIVWSNSENVSLKMHSGINQPFTSNFNINLNKAKYLQFWGWFQFICKTLEYLLDWINKITLGSGGLSIIILAIVIKIFFLPISLFAIKYKREANRISSVLEPKISAIKQKYKGEEAHNKIMAVYDSMGISTFYSLKPMFEMCLLIPILIALFNVLGEYQNFQSTSFLWIKDLSLPDTIFHLPFFIPFFGNEVNSLPFMMTAISIIGTVFFNISTAAPEALAKQKKNLYLLSFVFFILLYSFPSSMILYWTMNNIIQLIQQRFIKI